MDRIVLQVEDSVARAWRTYNPERKAEIEKLLEARIMDNVRETEKEAFLKHLEIGRRQAAANGLTPEILDELLRVED